MTSGSRAREETDLGVLVERLRAARVPPPSDGVSLVERIHAAAADPRFTAVVHDLAVDGGTLSQVSGLAARWLLFGHVGHASGGDTVAVARHLLAAVRAARAARGPSLAPAEARAADRALAIEALACFIVAGGPGRADARGLPRATDAELRERAAGASAETAALVAACLDEGEATGDSIHRIVATLLMTGVARRAGS